MIYSNRNMKGILNANCFNLSDGALIASNNAAKAQRDFSKSIAKLSTGRGMYGSDPRQSVRFRPIQKLV